MALIDQLQLTGDNTYNLSVSNSGASDASSSGVQANIYDGSTSTSYDYYAHHGGDGSVDATIDFQVTWADPLIVQSVVSNGTAQMDGGNYFSDRGSELDFATYLLISGSWTAIDSTGNIQNGKAGDGASPYNYVRSLSGSWIATGVRFRIHVYSSSYEGNRNQYAWLYMKELQCFRLKPEGYQMIL